jgi:hypothetical protein
MVVGRTAALSDVRRTRSCTRRRRGPDRATPAVPGHPPAVPDPDLIAHGGERRVETPFCVLGFVSERMSGCDITVAAWLTLSATISAARGSSASTWPARGSTAHPAGVSSAPATCADARFRGVEMTGVVMRGVELFDVDIYGDREQRSMVSTSPSVRAELDRRVPGPARAGRIAPLQRGVMSSAALGPHRRTGPPVTGSRTSQSAASGPSSDAAAPGVRHRLRSGVPFSVIRLP